MSLFEIHVYISIFVFLIVIGAEVIKNIMLKEIQKIINKYSKVKKSFNVGIKEYIGIMLISIPLSFIPILNIFYMIFAIKIVFKTHSLGEVSILLDKDYQRKKERLNE